MTTFFHTTLQGGSKQEWLGSVQLCSHCNSQQPKDQFMIVNGEPTCKVCYEKPVDL